MSLSWGCHVQFVTSEPTGAQIQFTLAALRGLAVMLTFDLWQRLQNLEYLSLSCPVYYLWI